MRHRPAGFGRASVLATLMTLTICLLVASAASAAAPEFGRCVKNAKGEAGSGFADRSCNQEVGTGAAYHWLAGPGSKNSFTAGGSGAVLDTIAGQRVECSSDTTSGDYTGPKTESLAITLSGCRQGAATCQSAGAGSGSIQTSPLEGDLLVIKREFNLTSNWIGVLWSPASGDVFASFECGADSELVTGAVLHEVTRDKMRSSEKQQIKTFKDGSQDPSCSEPCEAGARHEYLETSIDGATPTMSGLKMPSLLSDEEKIEVNAVV